MELVETELLFEAPAALLATRLRTSSFRLLAQPLVLVVLSALHLSLDGFLVLESVADHTDLQGVLDRRISVVVLEDLQLDLLVEGREEVGTHGVSLLVTEETDILQAS